RKGARVLKYFRRFYSDVPFCFCFCCGLVIHKPGLSHPILGSNNTMASVHSPELVWQIVRNNNASLVKRNHAVLSRERYSDLDMIHLLSVKLCVVRGWPLPLLSSS